MGGGKAEVRKSALVNGRQTKAVRGENCCELELTSDVNSLLVLFDSRMF
jgi:hypothetical protein